MDTQLPQTPSEVETTHSSSSKPLIIGIVSVVILLLFGAIALFFLKSKPSAPTPTPSPIQTSSVQEASQSFQSAYLQKTISIRTPEHFDLNSLIISPDRLNGIVIKMDDSHHFLMESKDDNSKDQVIPVVVNPQTTFYLLAPSETPPDGPFSGTKLPGDYSSSIKLLNLYTVQFQVIPEASDSASLPWVKDTNGSYIAKAVLLFEK